MAPVVQSTEATDHPPGFHQDINSSMLHELWLTLAAVSQPELINRSPRPSLEELLSGDLLKNVTWSDFWKAFPYKLADHGSYLDDIDALGLLLASPVSKQRFERYFDEHARLTAGSCGSAASHDTNRNRLQQVSVIMRPFSASDSGLQRRQEQHNRFLNPISPFEQNQLPVRRRPPTLQPLQQLLQQQQALVYQIQPPAAVAAYAGPHGNGSRLQAAAQPPVNSTTVDHFAAALHGGLAVPTSLPDPTVFSRMVQLVGIAMDRSGTGAAGRAGPQDAPGVARGRAVVSVAPAARMPMTAAGAAAAALIGRRRSWLEACDPEGAAVQQRQQLQQAPVAGTASSPAEGSGPYASSAAVVQATGGNSPSLPQMQQLQQAAVSPAAAAAATADHRPVWCAVHDMLTSDDEAMLLTISRLVPASISQQLKDEEEVKQQLQQLASVQSLPPQVVSRLADRMSASSDIQLLRITTSSGYSRRAVAAAAALEASSSRRVCYIPMAGCHKENEIEAAILQGIFNSEALRTAPAMSQEALLQLQQQPSADVGAAAAAEANMPAAGPGEAVARAEPAREAGQRAVAVLPPPRALLDGDQHRAAGEDSEEDYYDSDNDPAHDAELYVGDWRHQLMRLAFSPPGHAGSGRPTAVVGFAHGIGLGGAPSAGQGGSRGGSADRAALADQLNARLMLLGTCCKQPLLLLLDEVDMALIGSEDGLSFRDLLVQLMQTLPQAQVVVTCSWDAGVFAEFRRQGQVVEYKLHDGKVEVGSYKVPRPLQYCYPCC